MRLVAINPLRRILNTEIIVSGEDSLALLIYGLAACCAIEASGKFLTGQPGNAVRFHAFLNRYMSPDYGSKTFAGMTYGKALWEHFRNGLAHGFAVRHGGFEGNPGQGYFEVKPIVGVPALEINPTSLLDDFVAGFAAYLRDLRAAAPIDQISVTFNNVFEQVFIRGE